MTGQSDDMVWVPRVPTKEMVEAAWADALAEDAEGVWKAMVEEYAKAAMRPKEETHQ